jgi:hypothetical protein
LKEKINSLNKGLLNYENEFNYSSDEFSIKFDNGELGDDEVFFEWYAELETRNRIANRQFTAKKILGKIVKEEGKR